MPTSEPSASLIDKVKNSTTSAAPDKLDKLRDAVKQYRDLSMQEADLEKRLDSVQRQLADMTKRTLPDLLDEAGVPDITIEAEGNMPAYSAKVMNYYHANIRADWPKEKRNAAFDWLDKHKAGDLIKTVFTVELGRGEIKAAKKVQAALKKLKVPFDRERTVPWSTLTSFVKEQIEERQTTPPLDVLGAEVGKVVKVKPKK